MILLVTNRGDLTADWLIIELEKRGSSYVRFNTEDFPQRCRFQWRPSEALLHVNNAVVEASCIDSVWFRRPVPPRLRPGLAPDDEAWARREASEALEGFWRALDARWVSPPAAIRWADSKPQQLLDAQRLGFEIPDTEITNDAGVLRALLERSSTGVVCKGLHDGYVRDRDPGLLFTTLISQEHVDELHDEPHLFQARVPKQYDVRVTVIGDQVLAARIDSQLEDVASVDWRRDPDDLSYSVEQLPVGVSDRCQELVAHYGLQFGAIDLARRPDGSYVFFELNPNGQWAWVEQRTGLPIRQRLADLLIRPR